MRVKKSLWALTLIAVSTLVMFDLVTASRPKAAKRLATDAVTMATPLVNSTVGVVRSDNAMLTTPVPATDPLDYEKIKEMVWTAIELAPTKEGLLPAIIPEGGWVVVKPNMVSMKTQGWYSLGDITDPRVTQAVLEYLAEKSHAGRITLAMGGSWRGLHGDPHPKDSGAEKQNGVQVDGFTCTWGDDYPSFEGSFQDVVDDLATRYPDKRFDTDNFNYDVFPDIEGAKKVPVPMVNGIGGWSTDDYYVSNMILNCDTFISVPALKVHNIPGISLAHKNYMGTASRVMYGVSGWWLGDLHSQPGGPDAVFSDLFSYHPADYVVLGGAWGMEGDGPHISQGGIPIRTNMILAGPDPVAVDAVGATVMGFNPWDIEHLRRSAIKDHGTLDMDFITVRGNSIDEVQMQFAKPKLSDKRIDTYYGRGNRTWLVHGVHEGADLEADFLGGETDLQPSEGLFVNDQTWAKLVSDDDKVDLKRYFYDRYEEYQADVVSYAFTYVHSKTAQDGFLWVGADDAVKVWLNDEEVLVNPATGQHKFAEDRVPISLKAGENSLMVKVTNNAGSYEFSVAMVEEGGSTLPGLLYYLESVNTAVTESVNSNAIPRDFALDQNYPNPFNSDTVIRFALPNDGEIDLAIYNLTGQKVATLMAGPRRAGSYAINWDGRDRYGADLASGTYLYQLRTEQYSETRKLLLLR
ncbi:MAG: DUF362 domain-containing protein [Gemmatimonadetes bacterium]|jgi:uncharacterized protein (DUF362 family)|nr:DUF362 domain-containing protein [Gemmatimonadota bacterium]